MASLSMAWQRHGRDGHARSSLHDMVKIRMLFSVPTLVLITLVLLFVAYQYVGTLLLTIGPRDERFVQGVHEIERFYTNGQMIRWTTDNARIDFPIVAAHKPLVLDLHLFNGYPPNVHDPVMDMHIHGGFDFRLVPPHGGRHYQVLIPPQDPFRWSVPVELHSTTYSTIIDSRPLGIVLVGARLSATRGFPLFPPLWQITAFVIAATACYGMLRGIGLRSWLAWLVTVGLVGVLSYSLARWPMQIAPFTMRVAALCVLGAVYGLVVYGASQYLYDQRWVSAPRLLLLMGAAYWLMPAYQMVMAADGVTFVSPYPPTLWVAGAMLGCIVVGISVLAILGKLRHWIWVVLGGLAIASVARLIIMLEFVMGNTGVAALAIGVSFAVVLANTYLSRWQLAVVGMLTLGVVVYGASQFDPWIGRSGPDFWILFKGARNWLRGGSMYDLVAVHENHFGHVFKVPPFYGMLFLPFVNQDGLMILFWHRIMNMLLLAGMLLVVSRHFHIGLLSVPGVGLLMLLNMRPIADTVAYGQIDIVLLFLLIVALVASREGHDRWAGAAVALGTLFKLYPVLLLLFFIVKRQWQALLGFVLAMLICNGIAIAVVGWDMHMVYLLHVVPNIGGGTSWVENQTVNGFLSRLFAPDISASIFEHRLVTLLTYSAFLLSVLVMGGLAWLPAERTSSRYAMQFGLFPLFMVLTVPAAWMHYQTIVVVTFLGVLLYAYELGVLRWRGALFGGAYALIAYGNQWSFYGNKVMGGLTVFGVSYKFYGLLLLLVVTVACILDGMGRD